ncbi:MAG: hypothetical protein K6U00_15395, partial [Armatimonadetes bacterium]|nr:hypothetical protein [Armatimonadota bacterium]
MSSICWSGNVPTVGMGLGQTTVLATITPEIADVNLIVAFRRTKRRETVENHAAVVLNVTAVLAERRTVFLLVTRIDATHTFGQVWEEPT